MPGKVKVRILAGRNLPIMDRASDTCDAFVEMKLGNTTYKTEVFRHSLNPQWNSEWFRFEVDDEELQDEPLQVRVMDYDTYSANDAIGKVYIDLNPLLCKKSGSAISGWFPIYDTMHGVRGEIKITVKVHLFSDTNKYRESSCGVQFFYSGSVPHGYKAQAILGFVEELVVNDDPEYQWIDKIRTPRASNEARQTLFSKLSGEVQRKIGLKALELGGNAVIGYHQCFDLEGESGIVVRGIGTAVVLVKITEVSQRSSLPKDGGKESPEIHEGSLPTGSCIPISPTTASNKTIQSPAKGSCFSSTPRRSSDSDISTPPKGSSIFGESCGTRVSIQRPAMAQESLSMLEYPFITMKQFPIGLVQHIGGVVSARSVKLLVQINNPDEPETRDAWWTELRKEVRSHCRALGCNVVLGYMETTNISDEVCILSASGTAAVINTSECEPCDMISAPVLGIGLVPHPTLIATTERKEQEREIPKDKEKSLKIDVGSGLQDWTDDSVPAACKVCHIPYSESSIPFPAQLVRCSVCRKAKVPDVLFMTIEPPPHIPITGKGCLLQARVCKSKKDGKGEQNAKEISDTLPFLEYELHRQLLNKLKVKGMNAIFRLKVQVTVGDRLIVGIATGTGVYLSALPPPSIPKLICGKDPNNHKTSRIQKQLQEAVLKNKECYSIKSPISEVTKGKNKNSEKLKKEKSIEERCSEIDLGSGDKEACILEIDDAEDVDIIAQLIDPTVPEGFELCNTETLPTLDNFVCDLQMFTHIFRAKLPANCRQVSKIFENVLQSLYVKLLMLVPCCLAGLNFDVELVDQDEIQVSLIGVAIGLSDPGKQKQSSETELLFPMDEINPKDSATIDNRWHYLAYEKYKKNKKLRYYGLSQEHFGVDVTPLTYIPGKKIDRYLGDLDFFFIRESSSIRENGGLNGFIHSFVSEILAIVRAHVSALGGNGMVSFHMTQCILLYNPHKNQAQCLINVAGDAVFVQHIQRIDMESSRVSTNE